MDQSNSSPQTPQQESPLSSPLHEPTPSDPWIGKVLDGQFEILELLGRGGMGEVYKARAVNLDKIVAVKIIKRAILIDEASLRRLQQEAKTLAALDHPNIPRIHRVLTLDNGGLALVVDYIEGRSLADELKLSGALEPERLKRVFRDVLEALTYTHAQAIIHRDIKPSNIYLSRLSDGSERGMLIDFGLAKSLESFEQRLTQTGAVVGTVAYMSPEQLLGQPADPRSDLYSLGCVMFEAATGKQPFDGATPFEIAQQHLSTTLPRIEAKQLALVSGVVEKATSKVKDERYASALEMLEALRSGNAAAQSSRDRMLHRWRKYLFSKQPSRRAPYLISIVLLGALCVATAVMFLPRHTAADSTSVTDMQSEFTDPDQIIAAIDQNAANPVQVQALQKQLDNTLKALPIGRKYSYYQKIRKCAAEHNLDRLFEEETQNQLTGDQFEAQSSPEIYGAGSALIEHYRQKKQYGQAVATGKLLIDKLDPVEDIVDHRAFSLDARLVLADLYDEIGKPKEALELEKQVMQKCSEEGSIYWNRAYLCTARTIARAGEPKRALALINSWHKRFGLTEKGEEVLSPENSHSHEFNALCYALMGDTERYQYEAAKAEEIRKAASPDPNRRAAPEKLYKFLSGAQTLREATSSDPSDGAKNHTSKDKTDVAPADVGQ